MPHHFSFSLAPIIPWWAIAAFAVALLLLLVYGSLLLLRKKVPRKWVTILGVLRVAIVALLAIALLQPVVTYTRTTERLPDLLVLIDTSKSMGIRSEGGGTRLENSLASLRNGPLSALQKQFNIHWFAFDRNAYPLEYADLAGLKATGESTRYADSLSTAFAYQRQAEGSPESVTAALPSRVLLVSDGDDLGTEDAVEVARKLGLPVDTLSPQATSANQPADKVVITSVQSPRRVMLGSETQIVVTLRADGAVGGVVNLVLSESGEALVTQPITFRPGQTEQTVHLVHRPREVGLRQHELQLQGQSNSTPAASSTPPYKFSVRVVDTKNQVLVLEDNWRWEFKFLRRIFEDDPSFSFTALLARGGGTYAQFGEADRKVNLAGFPQSRAELEWFDTIVLGDVNPRRWPSGLASSIEQLVTEEGKSLIVIAGPNLSAIGEMPELNSLLPVELTRESAVPVEGPIDLLLSREGSASPFFFNQSSDLPPLDRVYPPLRKRPAATILLEAAGQANAYGKLIVMAEHTVGRGRVLFVGTDTLWKWQMLGALDPNGVTPYASFWQQALRALAPSQSHTGGVSLTLQPERSRFEAGRRVVLHAQYKSDRPLPGAVIQSTVTLPDHKQLPLAFVPDPSARNSFVAEFEASTPGQYKIAANVSSQGKPAADVLTAIDVEESRGESTSTRVDQANLARIAAGTGGKRIDPADSSTWPGSDKLERFPVQQAGSVDLWGNLTLLIALCLLLGTDWMLRLLRGYV